MRKSFSKAAVQVISQRYLSHDSFKSATTMGKRWRFAPIDPSVKGSSGGSKPLRGIVFDVDGTLCEPQTYMFAEMRAALGITKSVDILEHIETLPTSEQDEAQEKIRAIERRAMQAQTPQPGLTELMAYLDRRQIRKALCTRNFDEPVNHLLKTFIPATHFSPIITRAFKPPKPDPAGILHIARSWAALPGEKQIEEEDVKQHRATRLIMVGDSLDDMAAGAQAGAYTVLLVHDANEYLQSHASTDLCIKRLDDLIPILENGTLSPDPETTAMHDTCT